VDDEIDQMLAQMIDDLKCSVVNRDRVLHEIEDIKNKVLALLKFDSFEYVDLALMEIENLANRL
jgi:hypothetical protein